MRNLLPKSNETPPENSPEKTSKSALKRHVESLQKLGKVLAAMPIDKLRRSPASISLLEVIAQYQKIKSHEAKRRQLQLIGKVMRNEDGKSLAEWIDGETLDQRLEVSRMHAVEQWRNQLLEDANTLSEFLKTYPQALNFDLHALIRNAKQEKIKNKPPKSARSLYKIIKLILSDGISQNPQEKDMMGDE
jgi:ribosome-associated protein